MTPDTPSPTPPARPRRTPRHAARRGLALLVGLALVLPLGATASARPRVPVHPGASVVTVDRMTLSSGADAARTVVPVAATTAPATATVTVDTSRRGQVWRGVGAALTDAAVVQLGGNETATRLLFDRARADGARLDWVRLPLSSTDFSTRLWTWGWDGRRVTPPAEARRAVDYLLTRALPLNPDLEVVVAPWSAPASMKDSRSLRGGSLLVGAEASYASMLVAQAAWLRERGVPVSALSIVNEPGHASDYTTMRMSDEQLARVAAAVAPRLRALGVDLWAVDHNWSDRARVDAVLAQAPGAHAAAAFHCYGGTPDQMTGLAVPSILTECTGTTDSRWGTFRWDSANLVVRSVRAGSGGLMFWNAALSTTPGVGLDAGSRWGCKTCRGVLAVAPDRTVTTGPEHAVLAQLARAARPGAVSVTSSATSWSVWSSAFLRPDGTVGVYGYNDTGQTQLVRVVVGGTTSQTYAVEAGAVFTWEGTVA